MNNKQKLIEKRNEKRDETNIFQPDQKVYIKKHIRQKSPNKYSKPVKLTYNQPCKKGSFYRTTTKGSHG